MHIYVAKFKNRPGLIKIGVAANVTNRMAVLSRAHGRVGNVDKFYVGHDCWNIEKHLHNLYEKCNVRVAGDGGTEFFFDAIHESVLLSLKNITRIDMSEKDLLQTRLIGVEELLKDRERSILECAFRLTKTRTKLDYSQLDSSRLEFNVAFEFNKILSAIDLGFSPDSVFKKASDKYSAQLKANCTPKRLEIVYKLWERDRVADALKVERKDILDKLLIMNTVK